MVGAGGGEERELKKLLHKFECFALKFYFLIAYLQYSSNMNIAFA